MMLTLIMLLSMNGWAQYSMKDIQKLKNDKEVVVTSIKKKKQQEILQKYQDPGLVDAYTDLFYTTTLSFVNQSDKTCELKLISRLHQELINNKIAESKAEVVEFLQVLRMNNAIDDILYKLLISINNDYFNLTHINADRNARRIYFSKEKVAAANKLEELFSNFKEFPDESESCLYQEYRFIINNIKNANGGESKKSSNMKRLLVSGYEKNLFPLSTYNKLEYLRTKSDINKRSIWLKDYFKVIFNAKNKMIPSTQVYHPKSLEGEDRFSTERIKRFSKITRRGLLYSKYDATQIVLLSQALQKASRRMGVDVDTETKRPYIGQEFSFLNPDGERETYVEITELDPQSQYNLARRKLRKDMVELQMMDIFVGVNITYEDLVMAAFETGYISLEDIEFVIRYDDLWNPDKTPYEKISGFVFRIAGFSSFFLPPPWNITTSIALGVIESLIDNKNRKGSENDNPATFIE
jgi:hypothetical protein